MPNISKFFQNRDDLPNASCILGNHISSYPGISLNVISKILTRLIQISCIGCLSGLGLSLVLLLLPRPHRPPLSSPLYTPVLSSCAARSA